MLRMLERLYAGNHRTPQRDEPLATARARTLSLAHIASTLAYSCIGLFVLLFLWFVIARPVQVLPRIRPLPPFVLQDQHARWVDAMTLRGQQLLISFTYTRCGSECGATREQLVALRDQLRADKRFGSEVAFLTISFDAAYDTPEVLRRYGDTYGADAPAWRFLTGPADDLKGVIGGGFGLYYNQRTAQDGRTAFVYDRRVVLVDRDGLIRAEYDGAQFNSARVLRDIELIQREAASSGPMRQVYEASHLFLCYPR